MSLETLDPLDEALELMYFGLKGMTREADEALARVGFGRAHHRLLYIVGRLDGVAVGELAGMLGISKQAMHRPLRELIEGGYAVATRDTSRPRQKIIRLTKTGRSLEHEASELERQALRAAFQVHPEARAAWAAVMASIAERA